MTLGPVLILLGVLEKVHFAFLNPLLVFGRVPLFYYILHFYLLHITALFFFMQKTGKSFDEIDFHFARTLGGLTAESGYPLPYVYLVWISLVLILYPICKWYNEYKFSKKSWWVSYV
jgi:predicted acyltransferase